jgi:serine/threonine protein kinase/WD40 repeat protein
MAAIELAAPEERRAFLDRACGRDAELRANVEALLQNHLNDGFLEQPARWSAVATPANAAGSGAHTLDGRLGEGRLGAYRLLQKLGEGGVGTVYLAEQEKPVRRMVALKVLRPGMDSRSVISRFDSERQALAMMEHPGIARVLDAGTTPEGRPYFVMELVRGSRITAYCDEHRLSTKARLSLFVQVCRAIQHAHQKGIIHRDIKPSNILVSSQDGEPMPKVIDFGIAKARDPRLVNHTLITELHSFIGTPAYMSPEQAELGRMDIDTRTDVYSLGVLLHELLTGITPFDPEQLASMALDDMRRTIRECDPPPPSLQLQRMGEIELATAALRRQTEPAALLGEVRGDLDWIVVKTLDKDPNRRYESPDSLATDIQRHLDDLPVLARPPSSRYRLQKLVRRNRLAFALAGTFALALTLGLVLAATQFRQKGIAYRRAIEAEQRERVMRQAAEQARLTEAKLRRETQLQGLRARSKAYAADINLIEQALKQDNLGRAVHLLNAQRPAPDPELLELWPEPDPRDWEWRYLWSESRSQALKRLCQLTNEIGSLSISADGTCLAVSERGGNLSILDLNSGRRIAIPPSPQGHREAVFSPTGPLLAFSSVQSAGFPPVEDRIQLWDVARDQSLMELRLGGVSRGLAFSEDGSTLATATASGELVLWRVADGERTSIAHVLGDGRIRLPVRFSPDLALAACAIEGGKLRLVETRTGRQLWNVQAADENLCALAFAPNGQSLASGAGFVESTIRLWDVVSGTEAGRFEGHRSWISSLAFWPDGKTLVSGSADQTIRIWDVATRKEIDTLRGHQLEVWSLALSPDTTRLVSGSKDGSVFLWDSQLPRATGSSTRSLLAQGVRTWLFSPDSRSLLVVERDGAVAKYEGEDFGRREGLLKLATSPPWSRFTADGRFLVAARGGDILEVWRIEDRHRIGQILLPRRAAYPVLLLPKSNRLLTRHFRDGTYQEWDIATGTPTGSWQADPAPALPRVFAVSANAEWLVLADALGIGRIRNLATQIEQPIDFGLKQLAALAISPDGERVAAVSAGGEGGLWERQNARKLAALGGFVLGMNSAAFSPNGKRLAIGSSGNEAIKLWDAQAGHELLTLPGEGSLFVSVGFSPDGDTLAAANAAGVLHVWHPPSAAEIAAAEAKDYP